MKIFIGICFFILLSLVGCGDKKGKEVSEVPVIRLDPDHVDTLKYRITSVILMVLF